MTTGCNVSSDGIDSTVAYTEFFKDTYDSINVVDSNTTPMLLSFGEKVINADSYCSNTGRGCISLSYGTSFIG